MYDPAMNLSDSLAASQPDKQAAGFIPAPVARRSVVDEVSAQLREAILGGSLPVGTVLPSEAKLATSLSVSRPVIREALGSLRALGLVTSRVGKGWEVTSDHVGSGLLLADAYLSEHLHEVRQHLEVPAAGYAALRHKDADIAALREILETERSTASPRQAVDLDAAFHVGIARCSGNPLLASLVEFIRAGLAEQSLALSTVKGRSGRAVAEHFSILAAIESRDQAAAQDAMRAHLTAVSDAVCSLAGAGLPSVGPA
jgi:DNA-binding FadR family transcriptional regulator